MGTPDNEKVFNPYVPPASAEVTPSPHNPAGNPWKWATHCLLGALLGTVGAAVLDEPWNEPIHWTNLVFILVVLPVYFASYAAIGHGLRSVGITICLVVFCQVVAFNTLIYVLHGGTDSDFIATPLILLLFYLALFVGVGLILRLVRRITDRGKANSTTA